MRVYHLYQNFEEFSKDIEIEYCDIQHPATISFHLARLGQILMLHPSLLSRFFLESIEFQQIILDTLKPGYHQTGMLRLYHATRSGKLTNPQQALHLTKEQKKEAFSSASLLESH